MSENKATERIEITSRRSKIRFALGLVFCFIMVLTMAFSKNYMGFVLTMFMSYIWIELWYISSIMGLSLDLNMYHVFEQKLGRKKK